MITNVPDNKTGTWGIDLTARTMWYEPWPADPTGTYRNPTKTEKEDIYAQSGEAVKETFEYFIECGGDPDVLISLLNSHVVDTRFRVTSDTLMNGGFWYTHEFYLYFQMFCKKVIGRYGWHFGENKNEPLSIFHKIFENGCINLIPWGIGKNGKEIKDVTTSNIYVYFLYLKNEIGTTDDFLSLLNSIVDDRIPITEDFLANEGNWISHELVKYGFELVKCLLNSKKAVFRGICDLAPKQLGIGIAITSLPFNAVINGMQSIYTKINNVYKLVYHIERNQLKLMFSEKESHNSGEYLKYQKSCLENDIHANAGGFVGALRNVLSIKKDPQYLIEYDESRGKNEFNVIIQLEKKNIMLHRFGILSGCIFAASYWIAVKGLLWGTVISFLPAFCISILLFLFLYLVTERSDLKRKLEYQYDAYYSQINSLEIASTDLMIEKQFLEDRVKERTEALAQANEQLKASNAAKDIFFANVSHELRTPLNLILSPLENIIDGKLGTRIEHNHKIFKTMQTYSIRLLKLINNILMHTKIESGKDQLRTDHFDLLQFFRILTAELESVAMLSGLKVVFSNETGNELFYVSLDRELFKTAALNILMNAFKFTSKGCITVTVRRDEEKISVLISDTGIGIPEDKQSIIFDRFQQIDDNSTKEYEGTGIGLSLAKEIIVRHGGNIEVESTPGMGSTFTLNLPLSIIRMRSGNNEKRSILSQEEKLLFDFSGKEQSVSQTENHSGNILLVEDNFDLSNHIKELLCEYHNVVTANNGREALAILETDTDFDLIISDVMMPGMDGKELFRNIKEDQNLRTIPFVFLTARADENERLLSLEDGVTDYIPKPFSNKELCAKVNTIISQRKEHFEEIMDQFKETVTVMSNRHKPNSMNI